MTTSVFQIDKFSVIFVWIKWIYTYFFFKKTNIWNLRKRVACSIKYFMKVVSALRALHISCMCNFVKVKNCENKIKPVQNVPPLRTHITLKLITETSFFFQIATHISLYVLFFIWMYTSRCFKNSMLHLCTTFFSYVFFFIVILHFVRNLNWCVQCYTQ